MSEGFPTLPVMDEERIRPWIKSGPGLGYLGHDQDVEGRERWVAELDVELAEWLDRLPVRHLATAAFYIDLLARHGPRLGWPQVRQVDAKLRKLRLHLDGRAVRIIYWIAPANRIVLLTVFMKSRRRDQREIGRARNALKQVQARRRSAMEIGNG
jgi:hypothetical protein